MARRRAVFIAAAMAASWASTGLLPSRGVPIKVASEMEGHGDVATRLGVYRSVLDDMQESAARTVEGLRSSIGRARSNLRPIER